MRGTRQTGARFASSMPTRERSSGIRICLGDVDPMTGNSLEDAGLFRLYHVLQNSQAYYSYRDRKAPFTKEQAELIKSCLVPQKSRYPDARQIQPRVYILFDMDDAGRKACVRAARTLRSVGITARVVQYADAKDPDEFLKAFGADAMKERLRRAVDADLFELVSLKDKNGDTDIRAIASLLEQMDATKRRSLLDQAGALYKR